MKNKPEFVTGLPDDMYLRSPKIRSLGEALEEFERAPAVRRERRRRESYNVPGTRSTRRVTQRILGEKDE